MSDDNLKFWNDYFTSPDRREDDKCILEQARNYSAEQFDFQCQQLNFPQVEITGPNARTQPRETGWCILRVHFDKYRREAYGRYYPGKTFWQNKMHALECANQFNTDEYEGTTYVVMSWTEAWEKRACELERGQ